MRSLAIIIGLLLLANNIGAQTSIQDVSNKIQGLATYATERTVAIKIIIGDHTGFGSGAIITDDGVVLTCAHVSEITDALTIITSDGKQYQATRLGMNSANDYSLLRIKRKNKEIFPHFELGNSTQLKLQEWVVAVGHPGGPYPDLQPALAAGKVRGMHKQIPIGFGMKFYDDAIQTDAPIFAGNSGGPLLDLQGKLIGINGAITLAGDLAFSVPIDEIKQDLPQLLKGKKLSGREPGNIFEIFKIMQKLQEDIPPEDMYKMFKDAPIGKLLELFGEDLPTPPSVRPDLGLSVKKETSSLKITGIKANSIAMMSGFREGDRIVAIGGEKIESRAQYYELLDPIEKGEKVIFQIKRGEKSLQISVTFDYKAYSRNCALKRAFVHEGINLKNVTVKIRCNGKIKGYGVIISPEGLVLTSYQILKKADRIVVELQDTSQTMYAAEILGENGLWDIALLKFRSGQKLDAIEMGDDKALKVGQWVISGGSESGAIQVGMVSALGRYVPPGRKIPTLGLFGLLGRPNKSKVRAYKEVIQHDSDIESGQFGTPLTDETGKLVGINSGHFYRGTTFAIPVSAIKDILPRLKAGEHTTVPKEFRPYQPEIDPINKVFEYLLEPEEKTLDEIIEDIFSEKKKEQPKGGFLGIQVQQHWQGVEIKEVMKGYPAETAKLNSGDIIVEIGKQKVHSISSLLEILKHTSPGTQVELSVIRKVNGKNIKKKFTITLGERP